MQSTANQMTVKQAINILQQVSAKFVGTLQDHQVIQQALQIIIQSANEPKVEIKADKIEEVQTDQ